jgi:hypothetical protein
MNGQKSKTLRIADRVDKFGFGECAEAATELRRLHEVNVQLVDALKEMIEAYQHEASSNNPSLMIARAAIAKATGEQQ